MKPYRKDNQARKICVPIVETDMEKARKAVKEANRLADLIELRMDYLKRPKLEPLLQAGKKPIIVTHRRREEGGRYTGNEKKRLAVLQEAIDLGASFVDVEVASKAFLLQELVNHSDPTRLILSFHDCQGTPSLAELIRLFGRMMRVGAGVVKIVTLARAFEDNLRILSLLPYASERKQKIVAFCMGEKGKMSRVFAPLAGAAWTFASLGREKTSAPGQLTVSAMRKIWEKLG
jgi:3-dehydroquinate dehydratase type I